MYLKMGTGGVMVASSASSASSFLKGLDLQFANRPFAISRKDVTYNCQNFVFANYGPRWKLLRKLCNLHFLGGKALADCAPIRSDEIGRALRTMLESSRNSRPVAVAVSEALVCANANIIRQVMLSRRVFESQGEESSQFKDAITELLTWSGKFKIGDFVPAIAWMELQGVQRHEATAHERKLRPDVVDLVMADRWALVEILRKPTILQQAQDKMDEIIGKTSGLEEFDISNLLFL
ncbi:hypothetical protein C4D60_Mb02t01860 [Musa balbisiana]|uniref:Uncharacterized protein n=1 Tax=Musa balbisiana TaxID=52838 RepID=A0A4S8I7J8_MUSBA|nr:hypothetical protein C4D60_Mb02t01860 [Musa balbisiana]